MRPLIGVLLSAAISLALAPAPQAAEFTDATGRPIALPDAPARVYPAGPPASVLVYVLAPEAMLGWAHAPSEAGKAFLLPAACDLPELAPLTARDGGLTLEGLRTARADLVIDYGTVNERYARVATEVQSASGVPDLLLDGGFDNIPATLRDVGAALGVPERGAALATYAEETFALVDATLARVPVEGRPRVYLARGKDGLQSGGQSSINAAIIARAGAVNVVEAGEGNLVDVTPEQLANWAPDTILTTDAELAGQLSTAPEWQTVPAVAKGRVFVSPSLPFGFIDAPPSVNRLIGLRWLMHRLYPDAAQGDPRAEARRFYELFYQVELDDAALDALLGG